MYKLEIEDLILQFSNDILQHADQGAGQCQRGDGVGDGDQEVLPGVGAVDREQAHHLEGDGGGARGQVDWVGGVSQSDREGREDVVLADREEGEDVVLAEIRGDRRVRRHNRR